MRQRAVALQASVAMLLLATAPAAAQAPDRVRGYVVDLRGATSGLTRESVFFPEIPAETTVPARGFGFDVGAHVYLLTLGPSRIGIGANYVRVRGTSPGVTANVSTIAPQLSFNFGGANGWSYLSAGLGRAWVKTTLERAAGLTTADSGGISAVNYGGGARWFLARHIAAGFDVRFHRLSGPASVSLVAVSVGLSVR
ncbi:MAG: outer membrane protein [Steroidobacteraceae bacterium]